LVVAKLVSGLSSLLTVPLLLHSLGVVNYGYYLILSSLIYIASFTDLGLSNGAINRVATTRNLTDFTDVILGLLFSLFVMSFVTLGLFLCVFPFVDWGSILQISATSQLNLNREICISGIACTLIPFTNLAIKLIIAKSNNSQAAKVVIISSVSTNVALVVFAYLQASPGLLVAVQILLPACVNLFVLLRMIELSRIKIHNFQFFKTSMQENLRYGSVFVVLQATTILSYQIDNLILGHFLGPIAVVELATVWKLCVFPTLLVSAGAAPLWGQSAKLQSQKRTESAIREALDSVRQIGIPLVIFGLAFCILGKQFVILWTNGLVNPSNVTIVVAACWVIVFTISQPIAMMLNGIGRIRFVISTAILSTSGNLMLSVILTKVLRIPAAPLLGSFVAQILFYLLPFWLIFMHKFSSQD
jgi:O-antigen/teichoic acid export membrane protein